jgi:nitric oxide dioxygenase
MPQPLRPETIATIKATVPALAAHGTAITTALYARLFEHAAIRSLFNQAHQQSAEGGAGSQAKALAGAVLAYAANIENLGVLAPAVERIAQKHVGLQILPEHYPYVATALIGAIGEVLGDAATEPVIAAWDEAFGFLAGILTTREAEIYGATAAAEGGWQGWRRFRIARKTAESDVITSFELVPEDGRAVLRHKPGQYLTFRFAIPGQESIRRNYSISSAPNGRSYRISVKREPNGLASSWLHDRVVVGDVVEVSPPAGDFFLPAKPERPVVLLSGGVGLTPMVSMLETIANDHPGLEAHFVHGALSSATHALGNHVRALAANHPGLSIATFYSEPLASDRAGATHDVTGLISIDWLARHTPINDADSFLCGPRPFLKTFVTGLSRAGVPQARLHYEFFGPADELLSA